MLTTVQQLPDQMCEGGSFRPAGKHWKPDTLQSGRMIRSCFRIPLSQSVLLSPSRVCSGRDGTRPDASHPTSIAPLPCVDEVVIPSCESVVNHVGSVLLKPFTECVHSQDHGRSHVHNNKRTPNTLFGLKSDRNCENWDIRGAWENSDQFLCGKCNSCKMHS